MSSTATAHSDPHAQGHAPVHDTPHHHEIHPPSYYVKIWAILVLLLIVSVTGPMIGIQWLTMITAFGIAIVKAWMVASYFMHLNIEKKYVSYFILTAVVFIGLFWGAVSVDVLKHDGSNWENIAAKAETKRAEKEIEWRKAHPEAAHGGAHGAVEHGAPAHGPAAHEAPAHEAPAHEAPAPHGAEHKAE